MAKPPTTKPRKPRRKRRKRSTTPRVTPSILEEGLDVGTPLRCVLPKDIGDGGREYFKRHGLTNGEVYNYSKYEIFERDQEKYYLVYVVNAKGRELKDSFNCSFFEIVG